MAQPLIVEAWSDAICPWCWIGWTRLDQALRGFAHADQVAVIPRAYRLMPGVTPTPVTELIAAKARMPVSEVPAMLRQIESVAASEGLDYHLDGTLGGDTLDAHRLIQFAQSRGQGHAVLLRFYRAYLSERRSVFDHESLLTLAAEAGLDRSEAQAILADDAFRAEVDANQRALQALGGSGVPYFLIGGRHAVSGAQSSAVFTQALQQAWDARPVIVTGSASGAVCGADGCAIP